MLRALCEDLPRQTVKSSQVHSLLELSHFNVGVRSNSSQVRIESSQARGKLVKSSQSKVAFSSQNQDAVKESKQVAVRAESSRVQSR